MIFGDVAEAQAPNVDYASLQIYSQSLCVATHVRADIDECLSGTIYFFYSSHVFGFVEILVNLCTERHLGPIHDMGGN